MTKLWDEIAAEFLHLYPSGPRLLAVAGADAERSRAAADALGAALERAGQSVTREHSADGDETALRTDAVTPFRAAAEDRVLLVSGPAALLSPSARGLWHFAVWQLWGEEQPHTAAAALIDVTDPDEPTRRFADYCALPAAYGA